MRSVKKKSVSERMQTHCVTAVYFNRTDAVHKYTDIFVLVRGGSPTTLKIIFTKIVTLSPTILFRNKFYRTRRGLLKGEIIYISSDRSPSPSPCSLMPIKRVRPWAAVWTNHPYTPKYSSTYALVKERMKEGKERSDFVVYIRCDLTLSPVIL